MSASTPRPVFERFAARDHKPIRRTRCRPQLEALEDRLLLAFNWSGAGADNNWKTAANWVGGVAPTGSGGEVLIFPSGVSKTTANNDFINATFAEIEFGAGGYTLSGNSLNLSTLNTAIQIDSGVTGTDTVALPINIGMYSFPTLAVNSASATLNMSRPISGVPNAGLDKGGAGTLILGNVNNFNGSFTMNAGTLVIGSGFAVGVGALFLEGGTVQTDGSPRVLANGVALDADVAFAGGADLTFVGPIGLRNGNRAVNVTNLGVTTFSGVIGDSGSNLGLTKSGSGTLVLSGANTFGGGLTLSGGTLVAGSNAAAGTGVLRLNDGTTLQGDATAISGFLSNSVELNGHVTLAPGGGNSFGLTGSHFLLMASSTITVPSKMAFITAGMSANGGNITLTKDGPGELQVSGGSAFAGTTLKAGTLTLFNSAAVGNGPLTLRGGTLKIGSQLFITNAVVLGGAMTIAGSSDVTFSGPVTLSGNTYLTVTNTGTTTFSGVIADQNPQIPNFFQKDGDGTLALTGTAANAYQGTTQLVAGTLFLGKNGALGTGNVTLVGGLVQVDNAIPIALNNPVSIDGDVSFMGVHGYAAGLSFNGLVTADGPVGTRFALSTSNTQVNFSQIQGAATLDLTGAGAAFFFVGNSPNFTGGVSIVTDTAFVNASQALGTGLITLYDQSRLAATAPVSFANPIVASGGVTFGYVGANADMTFNGPVTLTADTTFAVGNHSTINGPILGNAAVTKTGLGTLTLAGTNSYSGATNINGGTLQIAVPSGSLFADAIPDHSDVMIGAGATLDVNAGSESIGSLQGAGTVKASGGVAQLTTGLNNTSTTFSGTFSGAIDLSKQGLNGVFTLNSTGNTLNDLIVDGGTVALGTSSVFSPTALVYINGVLDLKNNNTTIKSLSGTQGTVALGTATLTVNDGGGNGCNAAITGTGGLIKNSSGFLSLGGANTYSGGTVVNGGTLSLASSSAGSPVTKGPIGTGLLTLADGTNLTMASDQTLGNAITLNGAVTVSGNRSLTLNGNISGPGSLKITCPATLAGSNNYAGATTVNNGDLTVNGTQANNPITVSSGYLGGSGTVGPVTLTGGVAAPSGLTAKGNVTLDSASTFVPGINAATPGSGYNQLNATGTVNLGNAILDQDSESNFVPLAGTSFIIINNTGTNPIQGTFGNLPEGSRLSIGNQPFRITYRGGDGNDVALIAGAGSVQFSTATSSVREDAGTATITVTRTGGTGPVTVHYATSDGSARAGIDYTATSGDLSFNATDTSKTFTISILDDGLLSADKMIKLALSSPSAEATLGTPATATLTITEASVLNANHRYVSQAYLDVLQRPVDRPGLDYWAGLLDSGTITRTQFTQALANSIEYRVLQIQPLYSSWLHRIIDAPGLKFWSDSLAAGLPLEGVKSFIFGSDEYFRLHNSDNDTYLKAVYQDLFGRPIDNGGEQFWLGQMQRGLTRVNLANAFVRFPEAEDTLVKGYYQQYVRHQPDPAALSFFSTALQRGTMRDEDVVKAIAASDDYFARA